MRDLVLDVFSEYFMLFICEWMLSVIISKETRGFGVDTGRTAMAWWQQVLAVDAKFNNHRAPATPGFSKCKLALSPLCNAHHMHHPQANVTYNLEGIYSLFTFTYYGGVISETLYIRRRSQLLRDSAREEVGCPLVYIFLVIYS